MQHCTSVVRAGSTTLPETGARMGRKNASGAGNLDAFDILRLGQGSDQLLRHVARLAAGPSGQMHRYVAGMIAP